MNGFIESELLTVKDLVRIFNVHENTIRKWLKNGLPYFKVGTVIRFEHDEVIKWFQDNKNNGNNIRKGGHDVADMVIVGSDNTVANVYTDPDNMIDDK